MRPSEILYSDYVGNLRCNAQSVPVLLQRFQQSAPKGMSAAERKALRVVIQAGTGVLATQSERDRLAPGKVRPLLVAYVNAWGALYEALGAAARVAPQKGDAVPREQEIVTSLFPDGTSFTQLDAESAWGEGYRRLGRMQIEHLEGPIVQIVGKNFLLAVRKATGALGSAIGIGRAGRTKPKGSGLQESLAVFGRAVGAYARVLAAHCDESDPVQAERFLRAMEPIDQYRASRPSSSAGTVAAPVSNEVVAPANEPHSVATPSVAAAPTSESASTTNVGQPIAA